MIRRAKAVWRGTGRAGSGHLTSESGVLADTAYSFRTRFENEKGTNPEDFVADYEPPRCWLLSRDGQHVRFAGNLPRGGSLVGEAPATSVNLYHVCLYRRRETMQVLCQMPLCTQAGAKAR